MVGVSRKCASSVRERRRRHRERFLANRYQSVTSRPPLGRGTRVACRETVIELLTNDSVIFLLGAVGLATTAVSILRDAQNQRDRITQSAVRVQR